MLAETNLQSSCIGISGLASHPFGLWQACGDDNPSCGYEMSYQSTSQDFAFQYTATTPCFPKVPHFRGKSSVKLSPFMRLLQPQSWVRLRTPWNQNAIPKTIQERDQRLEDISDTGGGSFSWSLHDKKKAVSPNGSKLKAASLRSTATRAVASQCS